MEVPLAFYQQMLNLGSFGKIGPGVRNKMLRKFQEVLRRSFSDSEEDGLFAVPTGWIPDDTKAGIEDGCLQLTREDMRSIFDPVLDKIITLVQEQIDSVQKQQGLRISVCHPYAPPNYNPCGSNKRLGCYSHWRTWLLKIPSPANK